MIANTYQIGMWREIERDSGALRSKFSRGAELGYRNALRKQRLELRVGAQREHATCQRAREIFVGVQQESQLLSRDEIFRAVLVPVVHGEHVRGAEQAPHFFEPRVFGESHERHFVAL